VSQHRTFVRWLSQLLSAGLLLGAGVAAWSCGGETGGGTDSNTHWLSRCTTDADCGNLSCICGTCTRPCLSDAMCAGLPNASCARAACGSAEESSTCDASCSTDGDCGKIGANLRCQESRCRGAGDGGGSGGSSSGGVATGGVSNGGSGNGGSTAEGGSGAGGSGGGDSCAPMTVGSSGSCSSEPRYYWSGNACLPFRCETCTGPDCEGLYPSASACDLAHTACYEALGVRRSCTTDSECTLGIRGCCGGCGLLGEEALFGLRAEDAPGYASNVCAMTPCVECVATIDPNAHAVCVEGWCAVETSSP
jgi:hypothetical protein